MGRYATIDVGSNSVLIHIAEKDASGNWKVLDDRAELTRLGEGLQATGVLKPEAMERTVEALKKFVELAKSHNVEQIVAVGTMALRVAKNAPEFIEKVKEVCGLIIEVIDGKEEARLSYLAVKSGLGLAHGKLVIFDVGGGSTEFIFGKDDTIEKRFSINLGAIRITEQYLKSDPVKEEELQQALKEIETELSELKNQKEVHALVGMGGTVTNLAAVKHEMITYNPDLIQGTVLNRAEIERQMALFRSKTIEERKQIPGLQPKRADVILAGAAIVLSIMTILSVDSFTVSDRGIRHGLMVDRFGA